MKMNGLFMCVLFFVIGCLLGARTELAALDRAHIDATWSMLLRPLPFVNILSMGMAVLAALLMKSPVTTQIIMKLLSKGALDASASEAENGKTEKPEGDMKVMSVPARSEQTIRFEIVD